MLSETFNYIFVSCAADDYNRVVLEPLDDTPDSDYINASYVDVSKCV
jgi:protein tyrosine phosphatase